MTLKRLTIWACIALAPSFAIPAASQSERTRVDPGHSTASIFVLGNSADSPSLNVGIAKVSGTANWDREDPSKSVFNFYIFPADEESRLLNADGSFRKDGLAQLARYLLMSFHSKSCKLNQNGKLIATGDLTVTQVDRATNASWSIAYTGAQWSAPSIHTMTQEIQLTIEPVPVDQNADWLAPRADLRAYLSTTDEDFKGIKSALRDAIWPIVVLDKHCRMPADSAAAIVRNYQGPICTGTPVLPAPSGEVPAWSDSGFAGTIDPDLSKADRVMIQLNLRLVDEGHGAVQPPRE